MKREKVRTRRDERERQESKNTVYCSKWAFARSCVTTSSIAHKENAIEKERKRRRGKERENKRRERKRSKGTKRKIDNFIVRTEEMDSFIAFFCMRLTLVLATQRRKMHKNNRSSASVSRYTAEMRLIMRRVDGKQIQLSVY